jgi:hypothetical protein
MSNRIPRRASRNLWQRFKRWLHSLRNHYTVIQFDEAAKEGMMIAYRYPEEKDIKR